jgi:hypothetical protein
MEQDMNDALKEIETLVNSSEDIGQTLEDLLMKYGFPNNDFEKLIKDKGTRGKLLDKIMIGNFGDTRQAADLAEYGLPAEQKVVVVKKSKKRPFSAKDTIKVTSATYDPLFQYDQERAWDKSVVREKTEYGLYQCWSFAGSKDKKFLSKFLGVIPHVLSDDVLGRIKEEYMIVQQYINDQIDEHGRITKGTTSTGRYIQIRTSGAGKGAPKTYSWYFTQHFVNEVILSKLPAQVSAIMS